MRLTLKCFVYKCLGCSITTTFMSALLIKHTDLIQSNQQPVFFPTQDYLKKNPQESITSKPSQTKEAKWQALTYLEAKREGSLISCSNRFIHLLKGSVQYVLHTAAEGVFGFNIPASITVTTQCFKAMVCFSILIGGSSDVLC